MSRLMSIHWSRGVSILLSIVSAVLAYRSSNERPGGRRVRLAFSLVTLGAYLLVYRRRVQQPVHWLRLVTQALGIVLTLFARRYPTRRPLFIGAALVAGVGGSILQRQRT